LGTGVGDGDASAVIDGVDVGEDIDDEVGVGLGVGEDVLDAHPETRAPPASMSTIAATAMASRFVNIVGNLHGTPGPIALRFVLDGRS
jgi:hypothetical protein